MIAKLTRAAAALAAVVTITSLASAAPAAVTYQFTSTAPFDTSAISGGTGPDFGTVLTDSMSFTLPTPITGSLLQLTTAQLSSCSVTSTTGDIHCLGPNLYATFYAPYNTVEFGAGDSEGDSLGLNYYFAGNAFSTNGVHETLLGSADGFPQGQLTVTGAPTPEPVTWSMMIAGMGLVGATMRRRRLAFTA
jgi:hypothetical protein